MNKMNWSELTLENFHQWSLPVKYAVLIFFLMMLCLLNYLFFFRTNFYQYKQLVNEGVNLRSEFEKKQELAHLQAYQKQLHSIERMHRNSLKNLVKENEVSKLLSKIMRAGLSCGLVFEFFAPDFYKKKDLQKKLIIHIKVIGNYHGLASFLSKIANFRQLITFENFEIIKEDIDNRKRNFSIKSNPLHMKMSVVIH